METELVESILRPIRMQSIPICLVGEIALNYYNIPRVLHEIEICVPASALSRAADLLLSNISFLERDDVKFPDVLTKHKEGFPRFRLLEHDGLFATIFPDTYLHLQPIKSNLVSFQEAPVAPIRYSKEILDVFSAEDVPRFPFPNLPAFFLGACKRYSSTQDPIFAMIAQQLVDGMDLDKQWCNRFVPSSMYKELDFALSLVRKKPEPEVEWKPDTTITRFNAEQAEALDILKIPGRDIPINGAGKGWREEEEDNDSASGYSENDGFEDDAVYLHKLKQDVRFRMLP